MNKPVSVAFEVERASVVVGNGTDKIYLTIRAPSPIWPFDVEHTSITIDAANGKGKEWLDENFPSVGEIAEVLRGGTHAMKESYGRKPFISFFGIFSAVE